MASKREVDSKLERVKRSGTTDLSKYVKAAAEDPTLAQSVPLVSVLDRATMEQAKELLEEGRALTEAISQSEKRLKEIKAQVTAIATEHPEVERGFRYGNDSVTVNTQTRSTLSKEKLLDNGVDPEVIQASMNVAAFTVVRFWEAFR